jgi:hypothetical protein
LFSINTWYNLIVVYDGSQANADRFKAYLNGVLLTGATINGTIETITPTFTTDFNIGRIGYAAASYFNGNIDEVALWNTTLTPSEISTIATAPSDLSTYNPVAWYRMGDNSTYQTPQILMPSNENKNKVSNWSLQFDGVDDYVDCGTLPYFTTSQTSFSISFWFNLNAIGGDMTFSIGNKIYFIVESTRIQCWNIGATTGRADTTAVTYTTGNWFHFACVYDGTGATDTDKFKVWINGVSNTLNFVTSPPTSTTGTSQRTSIGNFYTGTTYCFNGNIDEVSVYSDSLTSEQITSIYNGGEPTTISGATAYWKLGEQSKFTDNWLVPNSALNNYSKFSFAFDGVDDVVLCQSDLAGNLNQIDGAITVSAWVKTTQGAVYEYIVSRDRTGGTNRDWNLFKDNFYPTTSPGGAPYWFLYNTNSDVLSLRLTSANDPQGDPIIPINDGEWHHIVGVYDGNDTAYLYTDGVLQGTKITAGFGNFPLRTTTRVCIGGHNNGSLPTDLVASWTGGIDEVAIWNTALSGSDVLSIYNSGTPLVISGALSHWQMGENATYNSASSEWTLPDQIGSNDATSTNTMALDTLVGEAPNYFGGGLSDAMTIEDRVGDAPNSSNNSVSFNMEAEDINNNVPT